jgi:hypothetical protein
MSEAIDLSALDGNELVSRLAVVKVRALEDSMAAGSESNAGDLQKDAQRADTEAVLDECAARLLHHEIRGIAARWQRNAEDAIAGAQAALAEVERLRGVIREVLTVCHPAFQCPCCGKPGPSHSAGCPWLRLVAEAEKP